MAESANPPADVFSLLGGRRTLLKPLRGEREWIRALRRGLPQRSLESLLEVMELQRSTVYEVLGIAPRTAARRKGSQLQPDESDRLYRLARIAAMASEVLGTTAKASSWLTAPNAALGGMSPLSLLDTDLGARQVEQVLGRLDYGVYG